MPPAFYRCRWAQQSVCDGQRKSLASLVAVAQLARRSGDPDETKVLISVPVGHGALGKSRWHGIFDLLRPDSCGGWLEIYSARAHDKIGDVELALAGHTVALVTLIIVRMPR